MIIFLCYPGFQIQKATLFINVKNNFSKKSIFMIRLLPPLYNKGNNNLYDVDRDAARGGGVKGGASLDF